MKVIINAVALSLSCSLVFGSSVITREDLRTTRNIVSELCSGDIDAPHALVNKEDQYVFGLVKEIQKKFPLMENIGLNDLTKQFVFAKSHIVFLNSKKEMYKTQKDFCQEQIDLLLSDGNASQTELDYYIEQRNMLKGAMDFCDDKNKFYMNVILKKNEDIKKCKKDDGSNYIFFPSSQTYGKESYRGEPGKYRLEIEGENTDNPQKKYVILELQQYAGQNNAYACIFAPTDFPIHVNHMYFGLNLAVYKYTSQKLVEQLQGDKLGNYIGVTAEKMKGFKRYKATIKPDIVYLDDKVFMATRRKANITDANTQSIDDTKIFLDEKHKKTSSLVEVGVRSKKERQRLAAERFKSKK